MSHFTALERVNFARRWVAYGRLISSGDVVSGCPDVDLLICSLKTLRAQFACLDFHNFRTARFPRRWVAYGCLITMVVLFLAFLMSIC